MFGESGVAESCMKEALSVEISPLGYHLSTTIKEKIWRLEYIDLLTLLPNYKEFSKSDEKEN